MKKVILLGLAILLCLTGCGNKEESLKCTLSSKDVVNGYSIESTYNINAKNDLVESVDTVEEVTSDSKEVLKTFETQLNDTYKKMNETYGGYEYSISIDGDKLTSKVTIDYNKMNIDQFIKDQPTLKSYVEKGKLKLDGIKSMYEALGATCE